MTSIKATRRDTKIQLIVPVLTMICLAIMVLLDWFCPILPILSLPFNLVGLLFCFAGLTICIIAQRQFKGLGANLYPFNDPKNLVTDGLFRLSRNPMYLGLVIFLFGVWALLGSFSPLAIVVAFLLVVDHCYVAYEEKRLKVVFGKTYEAYQANTPRWI